MEKINAKSRIKWVDMLKGVAIFCVVLGHRSMADSDIAFVKYFNPTIYSFHMPWMFFLSGVVFSLDKYSCFKEFLIKKIKTLIVPMVFFSVIRITFYYLYYGILVGIKRYSGVYCIKRLLGIVVQLRDDQYHSEYWFLTCLFVVQILYYLVIKLANNNIIKISIYSCVLGLFGTLYVFLKLPLLPWEIDIACVAIIFFWLGYISRKVKKIKNMLDNIWYVPVLIIINLLFMYCNYKYTGYKNTNMCGNVIGNPIYFYFSAIAAIIAFVIVFSRMREIKFLSYIGKNSLVYYGFVDILSFVVNIIQYNIIGFDINTTGAWSVLINICFSIIICVSTVPVVEIINRKFKFIKGQF